MTLRKGFGAELALPHGDDVRYDLAGLLLRTTAGVPRSGLFAPAPATIIAATATMNVAVAAFSGVAVRDNGPVFLANDATANVLLTNPPGSNSRLDVVYAVQHDASSYVTTPDSDNLPVFGVSTGIASASPVRNPAGLPPGALELGTVLVPSTATNTGSAGVIITPTFQYTALNGTALWVRVATDLTPLTSYPIDTRAYCVADGITYRWNGSGWKAWDSDWIAYTPAFTGVTMGSATNFGQYRYVNGDMRVEGRLILGAGSAITAVPLLTHPAGATVSPNQQNASYVLGEVDILRPATIEFMGRVLYNSTTTAQFNALTTSSAYLSGAQVSSTVPFTFASGDTFAWKYDFTPA